MPATKLKHAVENLILVDPHDQPIGKMEKILTHEYAMLHRAFSVFIFRENKGRKELLLQQRNPAKYHAGGLWTNTCCGHPHPREGLVKSAQKRLKEEMGFEAKLEDIGKFHYVAQFENGLVENEIDHVLIGCYAANQIPFNTAEVENYRWIDIAVLQKELKAKPKKFTPWFPQALALALSSEQTL